MKLPRVTRENAQSRLASLCRARRNARLASAASMAMVLTMSWPIALKLYVGGQSVLILLYTMLLTVDIGRIRRRLQPET